MKNYIGKWIQYARPSSCMQSVMPALLTIIFAIGNDGFNLWMCLLALFGVECAHLALNLADDWFDYKVDMRGDRDKVTRQGFRAMMVKYPYFTDGSETPKSAAKAIGLFSLTALICGAIIFCYRTAQHGFGTESGSWIILAITATCAFLGMFYSAPPLKLSFRGLGEPTIGFIFGPLIMWGTYYSACGSMDSSINFISIPVGILVLNILFTHSFIDMEGDAASNKMTFARLLKSRKACLAASYIFNFLPIALVIAAVFTQDLHPIYLIVVLIIPRCIWLCRSLHNFTDDLSKSSGIPDKPHKWLGPMIRDWEAVRAKGADWFVMRWLCARNILSGFCLLVIVAKLLCLILFK